MGIAAFETKYFGAIGIDRLKGSFKITNWIYRYLSHFIALTIYLKIVLPISYCLFSIHFGSDY